MLTIQGVAYAHPDKDLLFSGINLNISKKDKIALTGNNGTGKSTLLKLAAGLLLPNEGLIKTDASPYYVPQIFGQFNDFTIAQSLGISAKIQSLNEILNGVVNDKNLGLLNDDWLIEDRCAEAFSYWELHNLDLNQKMGLLSGGQKTRVFLAGIMIHQPELVLLDEPTNHLDDRGRTLLNGYISNTKNTVLVVSHDRVLLNQLSQIAELSKNGITVYGGNYDFYVLQKSIAAEALLHDVQSKEKALRKAREIEREATERQQKLDARGRKKQEKAGLPTISMNTLKNKAENSTSKIKGVHEEKVSGMAKALSKLRQALPETDKIKIDINTDLSYKGKLLFSVIDINFLNNDKFLWQNPLNFSIKSGERIAIKGANGSGKTTLINLLLAKLKPAVGSLTATPLHTVHIDQDYSLIDNSLTVYQQAAKYNSGELQEHEIKIRLNRFLFDQNYWDKPCSALSGGEKMRLMLCSVTIGNQSPEMIILDEPTNNLDIQNIEILTEAVSAYEGTLLVVSHDALFLKQMNITQEIYLN